MVEAMSIHAYVLELHDGFALLALRKQEKEPKVMYT